MGKEIKLIHFTLPCGTLKVYCAKTGLRSDLIYLCRINQH